MLEFCHYQLSDRKAPGVDGVTKAEYEADLQENIRNLASRLKRHAYRPQPVRRAYIPKAGSDKMRPLGIPAYEDKLVQMALAKILNSIYEEDFLNSSFGFRPNRGCHDALKALNHIIERRKINYIVDADDFVCCFQYEEEAKVFYQALVTRLKRFNLEIAEDKTKIIPFGQYAEDQCKREGNNKPPTFDFLGFTHYCSKSMKGRYRVKRKTSKKKYRASLLKCKEWISQNRNMPASELMEKLRTKLLGYYRYYGVTDNIIMVRNFMKEVRSMLFKWLNRRSQRKSFDWPKYVLFLKRFPLPRPKIYVNVYELRTDIGYIL